jgi:hypothetical protein
LQRARQEWSKAGQHLSPPVGSLELGKQSIRGTANVATFSGLAMAYNRVILPSPISTVRTPSKAISDVNRDGGCAVGAKHGRSPDGGLLVRANRDHHCIVC